MSLFTSRLINDKSNSTSTAKALSDRVYFIGRRYAHHARHSGYEGFSRYVGSLLPSPVNFRWLTARWGWGINTFISQFTRHPMYSLGALLTEVATLLHMLRHRNCLYHFLYGDSDLWLLGTLSWVYGLTGNRVIASFHEPTDCLRSIDAIRRITRNIDGVVLVSEYQRQYFLEFLPPERIFILPHGIDVNFFCPSETPAQSPTCITVGSHLRDFEVLKEAISLVWQTNPDVQWITVGVNVDDKNPFGNFADDRIQMLSGISDKALRDAYQQSQVAVFALKSATANNALLEAMACGLPIVITNIGGITEYVNESSAVFAPPRDAATLAQKILGLLNNSSEREKKAKASRKQTLDHDYTMVADKHSVIYTKLLKSRQASQK